MKNLKNIMELAQTYPDLMLNIRASDLNDFGMRLIKESMVDIGRMNSHSKDECLVTPKDAVRILKVSDTTIWRMEKDGQLTPIYIRGQKRYRHREIMNIINNK